MSAMNFEIHKVVNLMTDAFPNPSIWQLKEYGTFDFISFQPNLLKFNILIPLLTNKDENISKDKNFTQNIRGPKFDKKTHICDIKFLP